MRPTTFKPCHPGVILKKQLKDSGVTTDYAANALGIARKNLSFILNGHYSVSTEMAVRLSRALGTSPEFWLNLQIAYDLSTIDEKKIKVTKI